MLVKWSVLFLLALLWFLNSCASVYHIHDLPENAFLISEATFQETAASHGLRVKKGMEAELELTDSSLIVEPVAPVFAPLNLPFRDIKAIRMYRRTFDVDILTIPFKFRPSVVGFPEQLNANFSAALYFGHRKDAYQIKNVAGKKGNHPQVLGLGFGYGAFFGLGSVTMNPFVTKNAIDYEYDGLVLTAGTAAIYDLKKINLGFALGFDHLVDRNRRSWIYQNKPWFGMLFGINLN